VPVGSGVIMDEPNNFVVTQPTKGDYKAFTAMCTHQGCRVSEMRGDVIYCGCHQSEFSVKDGSVVNPPAQEPLEEFEVAVSGGKVYVQA
jgi:Rieske Fe-S protein